MPPAPHAVRLRDLVRLAEPVELPNGRSAQVRPFTFRMREMARLIDTLPPGETQDAQVLALVRQCVPSMTDDEAADLTPTEALAIVGIAAGSLDDVLAAYRDAAGAPAGASPETPDAAVPEGNAPAADESAEDGASAPSLPPSPSPTTSNS